jgi:hypothetical protein
MDIFFLSYKKVVKSTLIYTFIPPLYKIFIQKDFRQALTYEPERTEESLIAQKVAEFPVFREKEKEKFKEDILEFFLNVWSENQDIQFLAKLIHSINQKNGFTNNDSMPLIEENRVVTYTSEDSGDISIFCKIHGNGTPQLAFKPPSHEEEAPHKTPTNKIRTAIRICITTIAGFTLLLIPHNS